MQQLGFHRLAVLCSGHDHGDDVRFYVLFLQIEAHSPLQSRDPNHCQSQLPQTGTEARAYARTHTCTLTRACVHTHTLTRMHKHAHINTHTQHTHTWTHTHTHTHGPTHSHAPTHTHTHTPSVAQLACTQRENKEQKYQKKSVAGELVCKLSTVRSSRHEQWS